MEHAHQSLIEAHDEVGRDAVRTFQTEEMFVSVLVSCPQAGAEAGAVRLAEETVALLEQGSPLDAVVETILAALPEGEHIPLSILQVTGGRQARLVELDAPPLFLTRGGKLVVLPVLEVVAHGRLVRRCDFSLEDGDHLAMVSEGYIQAKGWSRRWGWRDIALSIGRLAATGGSAEELLGALVRMYGRLAAGEPEREVTVVAMYVRPLRSATVWSGPPLDPAQDEAVLARLMAEQDKRVICGDTTAEIAARLLGVELEMEPRPEDGWAEVPPTSRLEGVNLVTEGVVTLRRARERIVAARRPRDLPRSEDGATRLARTLLGADRIHFVVGLAFSPTQADGNIPWRKGAIEELISELQKREKIVSVEYVD
jgi:hypothetical protein